MENTSRRHVLRSLVASSLAFGPPLLTRAGMAARQQDEIDEWMNGWMQSKSLIGRLALSRFVEPMFFLLKPTSWKAGANQTNLGVIVVPEGFVTDLATIPREFWSMLRPDGDYAHAAIIHDYLYWTQSISREAADLVFKFAMEDLKISSLVVFTLYESVRLGGAKAWDENRVLKHAGEKRILKKFPVDPDTYWKDWKGQPGVFS